MATRQDPRSKEDNVKEKVPYSHFIGSEAFDQGVSHTNVNSDRALLPLVGRHPQGHSLVLVNSSDRIIDLETDGIFRENQRIDYRSETNVGPISELAITTTELGWVDHKNTPLAPGTKWAGQTLRELQQPYTVSLPLTTKLDQEIALATYIDFGPNTPKLRTLHLGNDLYISQSQEITAFSVHQISLLPKSFSYSGAYQSSRVKKRSRRDSANFYFGYQPLHDRVLPYQDAMSSIKEINPSFDPVRFLNDQVYLETPNYNNDNLVSGIVDLGYRLDRMVYNWTFTDDQRYPMSILYTGTKEIQKGALGGSVSNNQEPVAPGDFLHYEDMHPYYSVYPNLQLYPTGSHTNLTTALQRLEVAFLPEEDSVLPPYHDIDARELFFLDPDLEDVLVNQMTGSLSNDEGFKDPRLRDTAHGFIDYSGRQRDSIVYRNMFR